MAHPPPKGAAVYTTDLPSEVISFDVDAFDQAIRSHGVTFVHFRAMRCPVGMFDKDDGRRPHEDHSGCSNGFIYTEAGCITCLFVGNSKDSQLGETGIKDGSTVQVSIPRYYDGSEKPVFIAPFDRLYLAESAITVVNWQLVQASLSGRDRLNFPAVEVHDLIDSQNRRFNVGDFTLDHGQVVWGQNRPGVDPTTAKGLVYAIRYTYRPYWYVKNLLHEVRVTQAESPYTGDRVVQRMPQALVLQREYVFEKEDQDPQAKNPTSQRQVRSPLEDILGPR